MMPRRARRLEEEDFLLDGSSELEVALSDDSIPRSAESSFEDEVDEDWESNSPKRDGPSVGSSNRV